MIFIFEILADTDIVKTMSTLEPILVKHLFKPLNDELLALLEALTPEEWELPTVAKLWTVKDVAAHLLDTDLRTLSIQRDRYFGEAPPPINGYTDIVNWLNQLNADWIKATKRLSPQMLIMLQKIVGNDVVAYYQSLNLYSEAIFSVSWAGEDKSLNWMHLAREYTEKWHHQQQIREATGRDGIMTPEFFFPFIDTFFRALPHTFRDVNAPGDTAIKITIPGLQRGNWYLQKVPQGWQQFGSINKTDLAVTVSIPAHIAWKLFSKSIRPDGIINEVIITGDNKLAMQVLSMVSVMA